MSLNLELMNDLFGENSVELEPKQPEPEPEVSAKALEIWERLWFGLDQYDASSECKLTFEMMLAELERQNAPVFELDLKIYVRELVAAGYMKAQREHRERLGTFPAVTTYFHLIKKDVHSTRIGEVKGTQKMESLGCIQRRQGRS